MISRRYLKSSTILTSHTGIAGWGERLGDPMLAAAVLDRVLHTGIVVSIDRPSYRMRAHQKRSDALRRALHPEPNHDHRQLPGLRHHHHCHHPKPQPPLLLASLPKSRLASPPPHQPPRRRRRPRTASPATSTTSSTPATACLTPSQRLTASHGSHTAARYSPPSPSSSAPTPPTSNPGR